MYNSRNSSEYTASITTTNHSMDFSIPRQRVSGPSPESASIMIPTVSEFYHPATPAGPQIQAVDFGNPASISNFMMPTDGSPSRHGVWLKYPASSYVEEESDECDNEFSDSDQNDESYWGGTSPDVSIDEVERILTVRKENLGRMVLWCDAERDFSAIWAPNEAGEAPKPLAQKVEEAHAPIVAALAWIKNLFAPKTPLANQDVLYERMRDHLGDSDPLAWAELEEAMAKEREAANDREPRWDEIEAALEEELEVDEQPELAFNDPEFERRIQESTNRFSMYAQQLTARNRVEHQNIRSRLDSFNGAMDSLDAAIQAVRDSRINSDNVSDSDGEDSEEDEEEDEYEDDEDQWEDMREPWIEGPPPYEHPPVYESLAPLYSVPEVRKIVFMQPVDGKAYEDITRMIVGRILHGDRPFEDDEPLYDDWDKVMEMLPSRERSW